MGQEGIAQALALRRALHQPCDVRHVQEGRHFAVTGFQSQGFSYLEDRAQIFRRSTVRRKKKC